MSNNPNNAYYETSQKKENSIFSILFGDTKSEKLNLEKQLKNCKLEIENYKSENK